MKHNDFQYNTGKKTNITARFAQDAEFAEKGRVLKADKQDAVLCVLCGFAVKPNFYALKGFK